MEAINKRKRSSIEVDAALHGLKIKPDANDKPKADDPKLSTLQEENLQKFINSRMKRGT